MPHLPYLPYLPYLSYLPYPPQLPYCCCDDGGTSPLIRRYVTRLP